MSIILEALKKESASGDAQLPPPPERTADTTDFNLSRTMVMASAAILAVALVAFLTSDTAREAQTSQNLEVKGGMAAEGYSSVPPAPKQEPTPISGFITKLSAPRFTLSGVVHGIGKPAAIIENKILEEGASIKGAKVVKILDDSVEMQDLATGQTFILKVD